MHEELTGPIPHEPDAAAAAAVAEPANETQTELEQVRGERDQLLDLKYALTVEAYEEVTVPAGTFKTFRIRRTSPDDRYVTWYEPILGLEVKRDWKRFATHPAGSGTHQMQMLSYNIKN